jgi:signal transduction histidine kinase
MGRLKAHIRESSKKGNWFSSLRNKLLFALSVYFIITAALIGGVIWYNQQRDMLQKLESDVQFLNRSIKQADLAAKNFFSYEVINPEFHKSGGKSHYIFEQKYLLKQINQRMLSIESRFPGKNGEFTRQAQELRELLFVYNREFDRTVDAILLRGFKDYGKEGEMRDNIHFIEDSRADLPLELVLTLRRHEKDFILRKEEKYIDLFEEAWLSLLRSINQNPVDAESKSELIVNLNAYHKNFMDLVQLERKLGFNVLSGLRGDLVFRLSEIENKTREISGLIQKNSELLKQQSTTVLTFIFIICIVINTLLAVLIISRLGKPINELSNSIHEVIRNNFKKGKEIYRFDSSDEIGQLSRDFSFMVDTVRKDTQKIMDQKTALEEYSIQLEQQNEEITQQASSLISANASITEKNIRITEQNDRLEKQKSALEKAQKIIEEQNKKLIEINVNLESEVKRRAGELQTAYQELLEAHTQLDQFTYRSSHDLKGPIATLLGLCVVGRLELKHQPTALDIIDRLENRAREMERILNRLIFSLDIKHKEVEIENIVFEKINVHIQEEYHELQDFQVMMSWEENLEFQCDRYLLQTILENMIENSYQFRNPHKEYAYLKITWASRDNEVVLKLEDNGLGIPMESSQYIFDMFFKASNISKGSGLGLYIVKVIVEKLSGRVKLVHSDKENTLFEISFPRQIKKRTQTTFSSPFSLKEELI